MKMFDLFYFIYCYLKNNSFWLSWFYDLWRNGSKQLYGKLQLEDKVAMEQLSTRYLPQDVLSLPGFPAGNRDTGCPKPYWTFSLQLLSICINFNLLNLVDLAKVTSSAPWIFRASPKFPGKVGTLSASLPSPGPWTAHHLTLFSAAH